VVEFLRVFCHAGFFCFLRCKTFGLTESVDVLTHEGDAMRLPVRKRNGFTFVGLVVPFSPVQEDSMMFHNHWKKLLTIGFVAVIVMVAAQSDVQAWCGCGGGGGYSAGYGWGGYGYSAGYGWGGYGYGRGGCSSCGMPCNSCATSYYAPSCSSCGYASYSAPTYYSAAYTPMYYTASYAPPCSTCH
jgi:hypothetical protein